MARKKTHEEFVQEVFELVGDEYSVAENYINSDTKIKFVHNSDYCDVKEFYMTPYNFLKENGVREHRCPDCNRKQSGRKRRKSHQQFSKEIEDMYGQGVYEFSTEYSSSHEPITVTHVECGYTWSTKPYQLTQNRNNVKAYCPNCNGGAKILDTETFKKLVYEIVGDEYIVLGEYVNCDTKIEMKHNADECSCVFYPTPKSFINGSRCRDCFGKKAKSTDEFKEVVSDLEGDEYEVVGDYVNCVTELEMKHSKCNYNFMVKPKSFIDDGKRCPKCSPNINQHNFKDRVHKKYGDEFIPLDNYIDHTTKIRFKHNIEECGKIFMRSPRHLLGYEMLCPCLNIISTGENSISNILKEHEIIFIDQFGFKDCRNINSLSFDFAIINDENELQFLIEYDGEQHFRPVDFAGKGEEWASEQFNICQHNDQIKNQYCKDNNIKLYRIPYWYKDNIEEILNKIIHDQPIEVDETSFLVSI